MITFNGKHLPKWVSITGITFQNANVSVVEHEAKRRVGNLDAGINRGGISINIDLFIEPVEGMSILDQSDELKWFVRGDNWEVSPLILTEQPYKYYNARVEDAGEFIDGFTHGENSISFYCADPKKYDITETVSQSKNGQASIYYEGIESTPVRIEMAITKNVVNPTVKHKESDKEIALEGRFKSGDVIVIDTDARNVLLNGQGIKNKLMFKSNWINLAFGTNTFNSTSPEDVVNDITIKYKRAD